MNGLSGLPAFTVVEFYRGVKVGEHGGDQIFVFAVLFVGWTDVDYRNGDRGTVVTVIEK